MQIKYSDVKPGQSFKYGELEFTKLNDTISIVDTIDRDISFCVFDNFDNNYEKSLIRYYINNRYCDLMCIDKAELQPINNLGDKLQLLSLEEYEKFKKHIKLVDYCYWLRSSRPNYRLGTFFVDGDCDLFTLSVDSALAIRPALIFNPDVIVEVEDV
ncbi:MAG: hypothetical protein J6C53_01985 [Clostridia bacterium]|nr:hypothetical protein [Clostridia bacterium]